jgi:hypothetical protein
MKEFTKIIKYLWMYCIKGVMNYQFNKFYVQILWSFIVQYLKSRLKYSSIFSLFGNKCQSY